MPEKTSTEKNYPIDIVIAWVDGNDPELNEKRNSFLKKGAAVSVSSGAHATRFASVNEIKYCVLSILTFAPFIRNIYIVTDGQDPDLYDEIKTRFPEKQDCLKIVDHKEIFRGYEKYLPNFNSISIGHMVWRIKGLSDNFVYFNDDIFLIREMKPEDWFINNQPVLRGRWVPVPVFRLLWNKVRLIANRYLLNNAGYEPRASFHIGQWNSASTLGMKFRYFTTSHTPHTVNRKKIADFFERNQTLMEKNISFRFRHYTQFTFISLSNHLLLSDGNSNIAPPDLAYLQPFKRPKDYIDNKIRICEKNREIKYICVQSLDLCEKEDHEKIFGWMEELLKK